MKTGRECPPKGYEKEIERVRKQRELKDKQKHDLERKYKGENYAKERLEKVNPPSFLTKKNQKKP